MGRGGVVIALTFGELLVFAPDAHTEVPRFCLCLHRWPDLSRKLLDSADRPSKPSRLNRTHGGVCYVSHYG